MSIKASKEDKRTVDAIERLRDVTRAAQAEEMMTLMEKGYSMPQLMNCLTNAMVLALADNIRNGVAMSNDRKFRQFEGITAAPMVDETRVLEDVIDALRRLISIEPGKEGVND
jgi:hypothetical protein